MKKKIGYILLVLYLFSIVKIWEQINCFHHCHFQWVNLVKKLIIYWCKKNPRDLDPSFSTLCRKKSLSVNFKKCPNKYASHYFEFSLPRNKRSAKIWPVQISLLYIKTLWFNCFNGKKITFVCLKNLKPSWNEILFIKMD